MGKVSGRVYAQRLLHSVDLTSQLVNDLLCVWSSVEYADHDWTFVFAATHDTGMKFGVSAFQAL